MLVPQSAVIIDTDQDWIFYLEKILLGLGIERTHQYQSPVALLQNHKQLKPDLICYGVSEPFSKHSSVIEQLVEEMNVHARIVAFSKCSSKEFILSCIYGGASHFISKNIESEELFNRLEAYLARTHWRKIQAFDYSIERIRCGAA